MATDVWYTLDCGLQGCHEHNTVDCTECMKRELDKLRRDLADLEERRLGGAQMIELDVTCPFCGGEDLAGSYGGARLKCRDCGCTASREMWLHLADEQDLGRLMAKEHESDETD